jgi:uncharacterized cysteine cluster protein YcgN (CxxCxxCC family)
VFSIDNENLCIKCKVRGKCCYINVPIEGHNILLDNVPCPHLNIETGLCKDYDNRHKYHWCLTAENIYEHGGLPKGCSYLINNKGKENNPCVDVLDVIGEVIGKPTIKQQKIVAQYNLYNNIDFMVYTPYTIKNEVEQ